MGKSTISMVIFNSYVKLPEGTDDDDDDDDDHHHHHQLHLRLLEKWVWRIGLQQTFTVACDIDYICLYTAHMIHVFPPPHTYIV